MKDKNYKEISKSNGVIGILMGITTSLIGFYMIYRVERKAGLLISIKLSK